MKIEDTEEFQRIDALVSTYDSEGDGPLRKGESVFNWSTVEMLCLQIEHKGADLRVGIWLLRAALANLNIEKVCLALERLAEMTLLPEGKLEPLIIEPDDDINVHELILGWLNSSGFSYAVNKIKLTNGSDLTLGEIFLAEEESIKLPNNEKNLAIQWMQRCSQALIMIDAKLYPEESNDKKYPKSCQIFNSILQKLKPTDIENHVYEETQFESKLIKLSDPKSRHEVNKMLNQIISYFENQEPSHPAPIFIKRVQRMLGADFRTLMDELYVDANQLIEKIEKPK